MLAPILTGPQDSPHEPGAPLMYQWKTLRALAGFLLLLPVVHLAYLLSQDLNRYLDPSPSVWQQEMASIIAHDQQTRLPENPILVIGGQRVRLWKDLPLWLLPSPVLLRPLGDARIEDLTHHYPRLVAYYQPQVLVIFPGYADLHVRDQKSPEDFEASLSELLELDEHYQGSGWRYIIAPLQMPLHPGDKLRIEAIAKRTRDLVQRLERVTLIDPNPILRGANGLPNPTYYRSDGINLSNAGYARIAGLLKTELGLHNALAGHIQAVH